MRHPKVERGERDAPKSQLHQAVRDALADIPAGLTPEQRVGAVRALLERSRNAHRARRHIARLLDAALEWAATAPRCPCDAVGRKDAEHAECSACEVFVCARCDRWVSWDEGADDETPDLCDACAVVAEGLAERLAATAAQAARGGR